jgi:hypothetical protein
VKGVLNLHIFPNQQRVTVFIQNKQQSPVTGYVRRRRQSRILQCVAAYRFEFQLGQAPVGMGDVSDHFRAQPARRMVKSVFY